jgi:hypothetical protein
MKYQQATAVARPTYRTVKFGNLLSDTWQGQVELDNDGTWSGWLLNYSQGSRGDFRLGFASRAAAAR